MGRLPGAGLVPGYRGRVHLKTLTIKGFKSFASSTTLRLEPGITAVVGPNGSGKSNVVDALTWACSMVCVSPPGRTDTDDHDR